MEGTIGEIRGFAGNYCPRYWADCDGRLLQTAQNQALFSIISNLYGGNTSMFQLPDLRGRVPVGILQGPGLTHYWNLAEKAGTETNTLNYANLPSHNHPVTTNTMAVTGTASGIVNIPCYSDAGGANSPVNNVMGTASGAYADAGDADAGMAPVAASLTLNGTVTGSITIQNAGNSSPVPNMQPSLAIRWIICVSGLYPMRD